MAAKRSPILGYNHNVRFRGIVFHIQTEDSGIVNPHVFSHLFHGGVILSTRKLVYDAGANEDAVKSLMQAQHKAVMKDLRRGAFDDKIDSYLAGTPGLLPREGAAEAVPAEAPAAETIPVAMPVPAATPAPSTMAAPAEAPESAPIAPEPPTPTPIQQAPTLPVMAAVHTTEVSDDAPALVIGAPLPAPDPIYSEEPSAPAIELIEPEDSAPAIELITPVRRAEPSEPVISLATEKPAAFIVEDDDLYDATPVPDAGRAPTERYAERRRADPTEPAPLPSAQPAQFALPDDPPWSAPAAEELPPPPRTRTDISAALRAIQVPDDELAAAFDDAPVEIHAPALPSAPQPPGAAPERVGEYHVRKSTVAEPPPPPVPARPPIPRPTPVSSRVPTPSSGRPPMVPSRPPTAPTPRPPPAPPRAPTPVQPPSARTGSNTFRSPPPVAAATPPRTTPAQGASAITRPTPPAQPPRAGTPAARPDSPTPAPPVRTPVAPPRRPATGGGVVVSRPAVIVGGKSPTSPPPKVRRAKEAESFGGDLISERSLDEVILAYLSEDNSED